MVAFHLMLYCDYGYSKYRLLKSVQVNKRFGKNRHRDYQGAIMNLGDQSYQDRLILTKTDDGAIAFCKRGDFQSIL